MEEDDSGSECWSWKQVTVNDGVISTWTLLLSCAWQVSFVPEWNCKWDLRSEVLRLLWQLISQSSGLWLLLSAANGISASPLVTMCFCPRSTKVSLIVDKRPSTGLTVWVLCVCGQTWKACEQSVIDVTSSSTTATSESTSKSCENDEIQELNECMCGGFWNHVLRGSTWESEFVNECVCARAMERNMRMHKSMPSPLGVPTDHVSLSSLFWRGGSIG